MDSLIGGMGGMGVYILRASAGGAVSRDFAVCRYIHTTLLVFFIVKIKINIKIIKDDSRCDYSVLSILYSNTTYTVRKKYSLSVLRKGTIVERVPY